MTTPERVPLVAPDGIEYLVPADRLRPWHTVTIGRSSWHIAHIITCDLDTCPYDYEAQTWEAPPVPLGRYRWHGEPEELNLEPDK